MAFAATAISTLIIGREGNSDHVASNGGNISAEAVAVAVAAAEMVEIIASETGDPPFESEAKCICFINSQLLAEAGSKWPM